MASCPRCGHWSQAICACPKIWTPNGVHVPPFDDLQSAFTTINNTPVNSNFVQNRDLRVNDHSAEIYHIFKNGLPQDKVDATIYLN